MCELTANLRAGWVLLRPSLLSWHTCPSCYRHTPPSHPPTLSGVEA